MYNELPRSIADIPQKYLYENKRIWTILDNGKRLNAELTIQDDSIWLAFSCRRDEVDRYRAARTMAITAKGNTDSRALLFSSAAWESPMSSIFKSPTARMRFVPSILYIHNSSKPVVTKIDSIKGYLPGIAEWLERDFLKFDYKEYKFEEAQTVSHEIYVSDSAKMTLNAGLTFNPSRQVVEGEFTAHTESYVQIDFDEPTSIVKALYMFSHVENFFNFIFSTPHSTHIHQSTRTNKTKPDTTLYVVSPFQKKPYERDEKSSGSDMLFSLGDVTNNDDIFINWVSEYKRIQEVVDTLILLRSTNVSEEMRFTTIINALEAVHRKYLNKKPQDDKVYSKRVDKIISEIADAEDKEFVSQKLEYGNEASLRSRLNDMYNIGKEYGIDKPTKTIRAKILETRNYYTHGDESKKDKILDYSDLIYANSLLGKYIKVLLLIKIGVKDDELKAIVKKSPHFQYNFRDEPTRPSKLFF